MEINLSIWCLKDKDFPLVKGKSDVFRWVADSVAKRLTLPAG